MVSVLVSLAITVLTRSNLSCGVFARLTAVYRVVQLVVNVHRRISVAQAQCISEVEIRSLITVSQFFSSEKIHSNTTKLLHQFYRLSLEHPWCVPRKVLQMSTSLFRRRFRVRPAKFDRLTPAHRVFADRGWTVSNRVPLGYPNLKWVFNRIHITSNRVSI
jgi:hypothetical protein